MPTAPVTVASLSRKVQRLELELASRTAQLRDEKSAGTATINRLIADVEAEKRINRDLQIELAAERRAKEELELEVELGRGLKAPDEPLPGSNAPLFLPPSLFKFKEPGNEARRSRSRRLAAAMSNALEESVGIQGISIEEVARVKGVRTARVEMGEWYESETDMLRVEGLACYLTSEVNTDVLESLITTLFNMKPDWAYGYLKASVHAAVSRVRGFWVTKAVDLIKDHLRQPLVGWALRWRLKLSQDGYELLRNMMAKVYDEVDRKWNPVLLYTAPAAVGQVRRRQTSVWMPMIPMLKSLQAFQKKLLIQFGLWQSPDGSCAGVDFDQLLTYVVEKERESATGCLRMTVDQAACVLWLMVLGDGFGLYRGVPAVQLCFKIKGEGQIFSNSPMKCHTVTMYEGNDKWPDLYKHGQKFRERLEIIRKRKLKVGETEYSPKVLLGGDIPFALASIAHAGHNCTHGCPFCTKTHEQWVDDDCPGTWELRTFEDICELAHLSPYQPFRPFTCKGCNKRFETQEECDAEAQPWANDSQRRAFQLKHFGIKWKCWPLWALWARDALVGAARTNVLSVYFVCVLHLFLRQLDMAVHYTVRFFCTNEVEADEVNNFFKARPHPHPQTLKLN